MNHVRHKMREGNARIFADRPTRIGEKNQLPVKKGNAL
jgi:hypothetical protein